MSQEIWKAIPSPYKFLIRVIRFFMKFYNFFQEICLEHQKFFEEMTPEERLNYWEAINNGPPPTL